jgi:hypothetical protein
VGHGNDPHGALVDAVDHAEGICLQDEAPRAPTIARPAIRGFGYEFEGVVERNQKPVCCLGAPLPVVRLSIGDIRLGLG